MYQWLTLLLLHFLLRIGNFGQSRDGRRMVRVITFQNIIKHPLEVSLHSTYHAEAFCHLHGKSIYNKKGEESKSCPITWVWLVPNICCAQNSERDSNGIAEKCIQCQCQLCPWWHPNTFCKQFLQGWEINSCSKWCRIINYWE